MASFEYDLIVVGAGSAGVRLARVSSELGAKVAICEESRLGGTCVNLGCIPKKLLVIGSHFAHDAHDARGYGWQGSLGPFDWKTLIANKDRELARLNDVYGKLLQRANAQLVRGRARLYDAHTVEIDGRRLTGQRIAIATGSRPSAPDIPGVEHGVISDAIFSLPALPDDIVIVGGGYIALEFAGVFHALGLRVTLIHRGPRLLRTFDHDIGEHIKTELVDAGVTVMLDEEPLSLQASGARRTLSLKSGKEVSAGLVLFATGRKPNTADLGLAQCGLAPGSRGEIAVNAEYQSAVPSIYALGDVIDREQLTPVAIAEAISLAHGLYGAGYANIDYSKIATAVFSQPPIGSVGLSESQARESGAEVQIYRTRFRPLRQTLSNRPEFTMMKLVVDAQSDRVLGCHMVGKDAPEIIQGLAIALTAGATKADFDRTIGVHPTSAEEFVTLRKPI